MKTKLSIQHKYTHLLITLSINFISAPFLQGKIGNLLTSLIFLYAMVVIVRTFYLHQKLFRLYVMIAGLVFLLEIIGQFGWYASWQTVFTFGILIIYTLYLGVAAYLILRDIVLCQRVTGDTIRGGICVYLLIGFVWALFYGMISNIDSRAFSEPLIGDESFIQAIYFSFTTLTTLGYGDILPISSFARILTNLEAIIGQLYPAIFMAILVGNYLSEKK